MIFSVSALLTAAVTIVAHILAEVRRDDRWQIEDAADRAFWSLGLLKEQQMGVFDDPEPFYAPRPE